MRRAVLDPSVLVSGDTHLLDLADKAPILSPTDLMAQQASPGKVS